MNRLFFAIAVATATFALTAGALAQGSAEGGAIVFKQACATCHSPDPGFHMTGPSLADVWGQRSGSVDSFPRYSSVLVEAHAEWNGAALDFFLADPEAFVPGNFMTFAGLDEAAARADVIALLRSLAEGSVDPAVREILQRPGMMEPQFQDLKELGANHQVAAIRYCGDMFYVTTGTEELEPIWELNLRFSTDTSEFAPLPNRPIIVLSGMEGDRAHVFFADPAEISAFIQEAC